MFMDSYIFSIFVFIEALFYSFINFAMRTRHFFMIFLFLVGTAGLSAQISEVQEGQVLELILPDDGDFNHLVVPRKNFIIKRGGVPDMKTLDGNRVVVTSVKETSRGTRIVLKREDGRKFFRSFPTLTAHWPEALESKELAPAR